MTAMIAISAVHGQQVGVKADRGHLATCATIATSRGAAWYLFLPPSPSRLTDAAGIPHRTARNS
jgi:hypothetical protein